MSPEMRCPECAAIRSTVKALDLHLSLQHDTTVRAYRRTHVVEFEVRGQA